MPNDAATNPPGSILTRGWVVGLISGMAELGTVVFYARQQSVGVLALLLLEGIYLGIYVLAAVCGGRGLMRLLGVKCESGALRLGTALMLGMGLIGMLTLGMGLLGYLGMISGWGILLLVGAGGLMLAPPPAKWGSLKEMGHAKAPLPAIWPVVGVYLGIALVGCGLLPGLLWKPDDPHPYDVLIYHLQVPREWFELGRIVPLEHNVYSYFPFGVEIHYLLMMQLRGSPWGAMYEAQMLSLLFLGGTGLVLWGMLRNLSPAARGLGVAALLLTPWLVMLGCIAYVETGMVFYAAVSMAWLIRPGAGISRRNISVAGIAAGLAAGVKLTAMPMVVAPLALGLLLEKGKPLGGKIGGAVLFVVISCITVSPWLVRNYCWSGNPVFPLAMRQLGAGHFTPEQVLRFEKAHLPRADQQNLVARLRAGGEQIVLDWRYGLLLLPLAGLGAICGWRRPETWSCLLVIGATLAVWLMATHLQSRFFILAVVPMAILVGMLPGKVLPWTAAGLGIMAAMNLGGWAVHSPATNYGGMHAYLDVAATLGREGCFGLPDPAPLMPGDIREQLEAGREILLVGDATAFWYSVPLKQVHYRTVFDVDASGGRDLIDAWWGPAPAKCPGEIVPVVGMSELQRLRSYWGIPEQTPDVGRFARVVVRP